MAKPQRTPEEIEDIILRKIFLVSLINSMESDSRVVYLKMTAAEILRERKGLRHSRDLIERILVDRLSGNFVEAEPPFQYLVNCYRRAHEEGRKIASMKDPNVRSEMELVVKQVKKVAASYCRLHLGNPDMFPNWEPNKSDVSPLLSLIFSELSPKAVGDEFSGSVGVSSPAGFLEEFFRDGDYESLEPIMNQLFEELRATVVKVSALGNFQEPLKALLMLISYPAGAKALVNHPSWIPKNTLNGRLMEMNTILGAFFHVSALPDNVVFKTQPDVAQQCFLESSCGSSDMISSFTTIKMVVNSLHDGLAEILMVLLKDPGTRENVLEYLAVVINQNKSRSRIQVDPMSCASSGMFVNLSAVMLRLCQPFLDVNLSRRDKIDPKYVISKTRLELTGLTTLSSSSQDVCLSSSNAKFPFITESFFMTARVLNLGLLKAFTEYKHILEEISTCKDALSTLKEIQRQAPSSGVQHKISALEKKFELFSQEKLCYEAQIMKDGGGLLQCALSFYRLMVVWLVDLVGGFEAPLPSPCPKEFAAMPEHFVEDAMDLLILASHIPRALDGVVLDDFMSFIVKFIASPKFIRNPYLRAKMVGVLSGWRTQKSGLTSTTTLLEGHKLSLEHLVRSVLKFYVDIEFTGSHTQFYDKFEIRHKVAKLLEYLWQVPGHRNAWRQFAKEEEKGVYLNFLNFLVNDSIYLLDESLNRILQLKELEAEMSNKVEWEKRPTQEREDMITRFHSIEKILRVDMICANKDVNMLDFSSEQITAPFLLPEMVERVASMLNYFLLQLVGPRRKSLSLKDPEKYEFHPKRLLKQIANVYVNLARGDTENIFPSAIIKDCRSYSEQLFSDAADLLRRIGEDTKTVHEFIDLAEKAKAAASEALDAEAALGDIPEEFLDPIQYTLMKDPVIMPTSRITVDRQTIERHLLSDGKDPFSRAPLNVDMLVPNTELKAKIDNFVLASRLKRRVEDSSLENTISVKQQTQYL